MYTTPPAYSRPWPPRLAMGFVFGSVAVFLLPGLWMAYTKHFAFMWTLVGLQAAVVAIIYWYVIRHRARLRNRLRATQGAICPNCGYDLRALEGSRECPECGRPFDLVRDVAHWRRSVPF